MNNHPIYYDSIFNPNFNKNIWFNVKNNYLVKTEYMGNNVYRESYVPSNDLSFIINHTPKNIPKNNIIYK